MPPHYIWQQLLDKGFSMDFLALSISGSVSGMDLFCTNLRAKDAIGEHKSADVLADARGHAHSRFPAAFLEAFARRNPCSAVLR
jgi:hypothetical protein